MGTDRDRFPIARSLAIRIGWLLSPGGRFENSPAVYCRVQIQHSTSPEGTAESGECPGSFHIFDFVVMIQPSLRDSIFSVHYPTLERVGYCQLSLREKAKEHPELFG